MCINVTCFMAAPKERNGSPFSTLLLLITWKNIGNMGDFSENMGIMGNMGQVDSLSQIYMLAETEYKKDTF